MNNFFTSDFHYDHTNIVYGVSNWVDRLDDCRMFDNVEEMNDLIVNNVNDVVKKSDTLYLLGDVAFRRKESIVELMNRINCKNVHLILGNHDKLIRKNKAYDFQVGNKRFNGRLQDLFLTVNDIKTILLNYNDIKYKIILCHYKFELWPNKNYGALHFYGHSHSKSENVGDVNCMDVGIDNAKKVLGDYVPFEFSECLENINKKNPF